MYLNYISCPYDFILSMMNDGLHYVKGADGILLLLHCFFYLPGAGMTELLSQSNLFSRNKANISLLKHQMADYLIES